MDREEFFRLKKVQGKKKRDHAEREDEARQQREQAGHDEAPSENLIADKDEDSRHTCLETGKSRGTDGLVSCSHLLISVF